MNVPPSKPSPVLLQGASAQSMGRVDRWMDAIRRLARASDVSALVGDVPKGSAQAVLDEATIVLPLEGLIDIATERARLIKERDKLLAEAKKIRAEAGKCRFRQPGARGSRGRKPRTPGGRSTRDRSAAGCAGSAGMR